MIICTLAITIQYCWKTGPAKDSRNTYLIRLNCVIWHIILVKTMYRSLKPIAISSQGKLLVKILTGTLGSGTKMCILKGTPNVVSIAMILRAQECWEYSKHNKKIWT